MTSLMYHALGVIKDCEVDITYDGDDVIVWFVGEHLDEEVEFMISEIEAWRESD